jgi:hypothetical protein
MTQEEELLKKHTRLGIVYRLKSDAPNQLRQCGYDEGSEVTHKQRETLVSMLKIEHKDIAFINDGKKWH